MQNIYARTQTVSDVFIYGNIGESMFHEGIQAQDFIDELSSLGDTTSIRVRINSPGGSVWDGFAIYNALKQHQGRVSVQIDGLAASIASVIAMAADPGKLTIGEGAMMMIHDPWQMVVGNAADMRAAAAVLDKVGDGLLQAYVSRSKQPESTIRKIMADETWFTADEAIKQGLADASFKQESKAKAFDRSSPICASFRNFPGHLIASDQKATAPGVTGEIQKRRVGPAPVKLISKR